MSGWLEGWFACMLCSVAASPQDVTLEEARAKLFAGRSTEALADVETWLERAPEDAAAWSLLGDAWYAVASEWAASGSSPMAPLQDALAAYDEALARDVTLRSAVIGTWNVLHQLGRADEARVFAEREVGMALLAGDAGLPAALERAHRSRLDVYRRVPAADAVRHVEETAALAESFERSHQLAPDSLGVASLEVDFHLALMQPRAAMDGITRALAVHPGDVTLHQRRIDVHYAQERVARLRALYDAMLAEHPTHAVVHWYGAYSALLTGDRSRRALAYADAEQDYDACRRGMQDAATLEASFTDSARRIAFLARMGKAWCRRGLGDIDGAADVFLAALESIRPEEADARLALRDGFQRTLLDAVGTLCMDYEGERRYARAIELAEAVLALRPTEGAWWNNLGYFRREHASQVQAGLHDVDIDRWEAGQQVFRASWEAYQKAAEFASSDPRIVNDAALIQVYHLQDELPLAEEMLHRAIAMGQQRLEAMGDTPTEAERFPVAQAVGDAWENLGYLSYHFYEDMDAARERFQASLNTHSGDRGNVEQYLDAIAGTQDPIELPAPGTAPVVAGPTEPPSRGDVRWEPSFDQARERSKAEGRPLLLYIRGDALGLAIPFYDRVVQSDDFADATREWVCVLAAAGRNTVSDWDDAGQRVESATFAHVTCGEHIVALEQVRAWWSGVRTNEDPREPPEGLFAVLPDGRFEWLTLDRTFWETLGRWRDEVAPAKETGRPSDLLRPLLEGASRERARAADRLAAWPGRPARQVEEEALWQGDDETVAEVVRAIAARGSDVDQARVRALLGPEAEARHTVAALAAIDEGVAGAALKSLFSWSDDAAVQRAAAEALWRVMPDETSVRWLLGVVAAVPRASARRAAATALGQVTPRPDAALARCLAREKEDTVLRALCAALRGTEDEAARSSLEVLQADASRSVVIRTAARRALDGGDW